MNLVDGSRGRDEDRQLRRPDDAFPHPAPRGSLDTAQATRSENDRVASGLAGFVHGPPCDMVCASRAHQAICADASLAQAENRFVNQRLSMRRAFERRHPRVDGSFTDMHDTDVNARIKGRETILTRPSRRAAKP